MITFLRLVVKYLASRVYVAKLGDSPLSGDLHRSRQSFPKALADNQKLHGSTNSPVIGTVPARCSTCPVAGYQP